MLAIIFVDLMGKGEPRSNSCFFWLSARKVTEYGIVEVCSSIAKAVMIRTRLHTRVSVSGGHLAMIGMTDLLPPYRSSSDDAL